ncbi:MAG: hypothetical protein MUO85_01185 [candidate division Zixibacteria bacterium]|nr:hypothetical protein [candidate division Zixibacteria bacterium]
MNKIKVLFADETTFLLVDEEQGILRKRCDSDGKQIPLEVEETSFVQNKINERVLIKVSEEGLKKGESLEKECGSSSSRKLTKSGQDEFLSLRHKTGSSCLTKGRRGQKNSGAGSPTYKNHKNRSKKAKTKRGRKCKS